MPLTNTAIKKAKPSPKPVKLGDARGLYLLFNPVGSKLWRWKFRVLGKEKVLALGAYPDVPLAQAREGVDVDFHPKLTPPTGVNSGWHLTRGAREVFGLELCKGPRIGNFCRHRELV